MISPKDHKFPITEPKGTEIVKILTKNINSNGKSYKLSQIRHKLEKSFLLL